MRAFFKFSEFNLILRVIQGESMILESSFSIESELVLSPADLRENYLFGTVCRDSSGRELSDEVIKLYIKAAQQYIENYFNLKLVYQIIEESRDYNLDDYKNFGYIRATYPINVAYTLKGKFGETEQIVYPREWLSTKKSSDNPEMYYRNLYLIPNVGGYSSGAQSSGVVFNGVFGANLLWKSRTYIPNYWRIRYLTGFKQTPADLLNIIGKLASVDVLHIAGDLILGAGIASYSLGIDGLSQSISSTSSATNAGYGARILNYLDDVKRLLPILENKYKGFTVNSM